jgi:hypothetical protein
LANTDPYAPITLKLNQFIISTARSDAPTCCVDAALKSARNNKYFASPRSPLGTSFASSPRALAFLFSSTTTVATINLLTPSRPQKPVDNSIQPPLGCKMQRSNSQRSGGLNRSGSHRDQKKVHPQELGAPTQAKQATSFYLVVCGATKAKDHWIFSDFMGYCFLLKQKGVGGDFLNCLDLDQCFGELSLENVSTIAFGQLKDKTAPLLRYPRFQHFNQEYFFKQIDPKLILGEVAAWVKEKAGIAVPSDVINIIIECHGSESGLRVGANQLTPEDSKKMCEKFVQGVQVNFITGACYSGVFTEAIGNDGQKNRWITASSSATSTATAYMRSPSNRTRNSRFSQAFVQSLSRIVIPGIHQVPQLTISDHNKFMKEVTYRSISGSTPDNLAENQYQSYIEPDDLTQLVEQIVFREKIDVLYDPAITSSRRRIEYPSLDNKVLPVFLERFDTSKPKNLEPEKVKNELRMIIAAEKKHCDPNEYLPSFEVGVFDDWWYDDDRPYNYGEVLKLFYWRGRIQNAVKDVFHTLLSRGLISAVGLTQPISLGASNKEVADLTALLLCFKGVTSSTTRTASSPYGLEFEDPVHWLSIVILRGFEAPIHDILDTIMMSKFLGELDEEAFQKYVDDKPYASSYVMKGYTLDPNVCLGKPKPHKGCAWGFWLPYQLQTNDLSVVAEEFDEGRKRFNAIEKCFRDWFGLKQEELVLEEEQAEYFEKFPEREPGFRFSGFQYPSPESSES